jgi:hypothetical protein
MIMFNPLLVVVIIIQVIVSRNSRKTGAIFGYVITTGILLWGISSYASGGAIALVGLRLSAIEFFILCLIWYAADTVEFFTAREKESREKEANIVQPEEPRYVNIGTPGALGSEQLTTPCKIIFFRDKALFGAIVPQTVNLNGREIGDVNNGKSIEFTTNKKSNAITVTDRAGGISKPYKFDAVEGGLIEVHFKMGKFN